ncbi:primosome assembly protein PriA [Aeromicrobium sp. CF4.19]|uniref:primosomal protein N' family DNA-binding protein n=1 Tax=Aeromicrobium sp. CF4.19 TaxID=3373082 RepID=UPI003EE7E5B6
MTEDVEQEPEESGQLSLVPAARPVVGPMKAGPAAAPRLPIARVVVDTPLAHLDRPFDYLVPEELDELTVPGCRVKVRFAGRLTDAYVIERVENTLHEGTLAPLAKVVSAEPLLTPDLLALCRDVADRWAGTLTDVLRLAIPPRHARAEAQPSVSPDAGLPPITDDTWTPWPDGPGLVAALARGESPRACWAALPHRDPARAVAEAVLATVHSGRGAVVCVPDVRDVARWDAVFAEVLGPGRYVVLTAAEKPAARYRAYLAAARGSVRVVLGTRAAAMAPVQDLGLVVIWDDGDDLYAEPRAPYPHAREVLLTRVARESCALLVAGFARTAEAQSLVASGWCSDIVAEPTIRRRAWPRLDVTDGSVDGGAPARLPREVFTGIRSADGPVLVQVPRRGYRASLACQDCRTAARCRSCDGPLAQAGRDRGVACRWCGAEAAPWRCEECGSGRLRAPVIGQLRTAEEYAAAFSQRTVVTSGGSTVLAEVDRGDVIVLATPGAEPRVEGGYELVVLMDTWLALGREDVRVVEEAHRRWLNALALARETTRAIAVGDPVGLQGLVRADPVGLARRELATRAETHLPPVGRLALVEGSAEAIEPLVQRTWTPHTEVMGPVPLEPAAGPARGRGDAPPHAAQLVLRAPRREGPALAAALKTVQAERSAAKLPPLRVRVDPHDL